MYFFSDFTLSTYLYRTGTHICASKLPWLHHFSTFSIYFIYTKKERRKLAYISETCDKWPLNIQKDPVETKEKEILVNNFGFIPRKSTRN